MRNICSIFIPGRLLSGISFWVLGYVESNMYKENIYDQYDRDSENNGIWQMILINGIGTGVILKAFHMAKGCNTCLKTFRMAKETLLTTWWNLTPFCQDHLVKGVLSTSLCVM